MFTESRLKEARKDTDEHHILSVQHQYITWFYKYIVFTVFTA